MGRSEDCPACAPQVRAVFSTLQALRVTEVGQLREVVACTGAAVVAVTGPTFQAPRVTKVGQRREEMTSTQRAPDLVNQLLALGWSLLAWRRIHGGTSPRSPGKP